MTWSFIDTEDRWWTLFQKADLRYAEAYYSDPMAMGLLDPEEAALRGKGLIWTLIGPDGGVVPLPDNPDIDPDLPIYDPKTQAIWFAQDYVWPYNIKYRRFVIRTKETDLAPPAGNPDVSGASAGARPSEGKAVIDSSEGGLASAAQSSPRKKGNDEPSAPVHGWIRPMEASPRSERPAPVQEIARTSRPSASIPVSSFALVEEQTPIEELKTGEGLIQQDVYYVGRGKYDEPVFASAITARNGRYNATTVYTRQYVACWEGVAQRY